MGEIRQNPKELTSDDVCKIAPTATGSSRPLRPLRDERGFCKAVSTDGEIKEHEYIIVPGRVGAPPLPMTVSRSKMAQLTKELGEHFAESRRLEDEIRKTWGIWVLTSESCR